MLRLLAVLVVLLVLSACGRPPPPPDALSILREYGWEATVPEPQPTWNPTNYQVLMRAAAGFAILDEGQGRQEYFASKEKREYHHPAWIDGQRFVVGPRSNVITTEDGRVVPNTDGIQVFTVRVGRPVEINELGLVGFRPRPWNDRIVAQVDQRIGLYDLNGTMVEFGPGFLAEPQREGEGIAYQETPVFERDHWTAKPVLSNVVVRWQRGKVDTIPRAVQPQWTAAGGVVAVQLAVAPDQAKDWWQGGTTLVHLPRAGAALKTLGTNLRNPDPHPGWPMVAANDAEGRVILLSLADGSQRVLADQGERPRWSADGKRLLVEEVLLTGSSAGRTYVRVYVLGIIDER